jgi:hypothetical protein
VELTFVKVDIDILGSGTAREHIGLYLLQLSPEIDHPLCHPLIG